MNLAKRYSQAAVETASKERVMLLLLEAALRHMRTGAAALESGRPTEASAPISKSCEIMVHLLSTLDRSRAPQLVEQLASVYTFVCQRLTSANLRHEVGLIREAERAFVPVVEAFSAAVSSLPGTEVR